MTRSRILTLAILLAAVSPLLSACGTTAGIGQDISETGRAVTRSSDTVRKGL